MKGYIFKKIKPVTPSQRHYKTLLNFYISKKKGIKSKTIYLSKHSGRNYSGSITVYRQGGGHKKLYRYIDFSRKNSEGVVEGLEYDPFRNCFIARVFNKKNKTFYYILAPKNIFRGCFVKSNEFSEVKIGHSLVLDKIPVGLLVHNLSTSLNKKGQYARAAGTFAQIVQKTRKHARIRLSSGEQRLVLLTAKATLGSVSNENFSLTTLGKAGRSRWLGYRPRVRGVAMNPIDHPHGGGEGKTSGGRPSVTPWGKPTKGFKTSRSKNSLIVVHRLKK